MPWWGWLIVFWVVIALMCSFWLGVAIGQADRREQVARQKRFDAALARITKGTDVIQTSIATVQDSLPGSTSGGK